MIKRKISLLLAGVFLWTQVCLSGTVWAAPLADKALFLEDTIPKELGQLRKVHLSEVYSQDLYRKEGLGAALAKITADNHPLVVLIEDAHASVEAQMNIANLIEFIRTNWRITLLALEGAEGEAPLAKVDVSPMSEEREEVLDFYLRQALLSGPEYEALRSPESYKVRGVENMEVYESDRKVYLDVAEKRYEIDQVLNTAEIRLDKEKEKHYSAELLTFDRKEHHFEKSPERYLSSFVPYLVREAARKGLKPSDQSPLALAARVLTNAQNISLQDLKKEMVMFRQDGEKFSREIEVLEKRFLPRGFDFDFAVTGPPPRIPPFFLYRFPSLRAYLDLAEMRYRSDAVQMFSEINDFTMKTKKLLSRSPKELELDERTRNLEVLRRVLHLEARHEDFPGSGAVRLARELGLSGLYDKARFFYELAAKRDEILALNTLQAINETTSPPKAAILVAGGFHAEGIQKVLENSKVNYLIITPQFNSDLSDDRLYQMRLKDDLSLVGSSIASPRRIMDRTFLEEIENSARNLGLGMSLEKAVGEARKKRLENIARIQTARILRLTRKTDIPALVPKSEIQGASLGNAGERYADLEKKILDLYQPGPLEGREDLIQKLKRKAIRTTEFVEILADESGMDPAGREYLKIAALTGDLGKGYTDEKLKLHYSTLRKPEMTPSQQKEIEEFVEDGFRILKHYDIKIPDVSQLLVRAVYQKNEAAKRTLEKAGLEQTVSFLKLASQFAALISAIPYAKDVHLKTNRDIDRWLKELEGRGEISAETRKKAAPVFRSIIANFKESTVNPSYVGSFLAPGIPKPLFHDEIIRLAEFRDLSLAAIAPLLETPEMAHEDLRKRLDRWSEITDAEKDALLSKFSVEFFEDMKAAYKAGDQEKQVRFLIAYENVLKKLGENEDKAFEQPRKKLLDKRGSIRAKGRGLKRVVIAEDTEIMRQYLEAKVAKQNPTAQIISGPTGEAVLDLLQKQIDKNPSYTPDLVITDIQMLEKGKTLMSGWEFSQKMKQMFPGVMVLVESSVTYPIEAEVEGAISKYDLLFLEYVLDLYEKEYLDRREIKGASLGQAAPSAQPVWSREEIVAAAQMNMESSPLSAYLFLPASLLGKVPAGSVSSALKNDAVHLEVLWDTAEGPAERIERLHSLGWDTFIKKRNFHPNIADQKLDSLKSLADKVTYRYKTLEEKGISGKQVGFLKPTELETTIPEVLSLKEGAPYPVFLLLYLIQIEGSSAHDLLNIFSFDPKRGDFTAFLDKELERLLAAHFAVQATKRAA